MSARSAGDLIFILSFALVGVTVPTALLLLGRFLRPSRPGKVKLEPYECGLPQASAPHRQPRVRYYTFALLFVVFDVETVLLFAAAPLLKRHGTTGLAGVGIFVALVTLALAHAWRAGLLSWE